MDARGPVHRRHKPSAHSINFKHPFRRNPRWRDTSWKPGCSSFHQHVAVRSGLLVRYIMVQCVSKCGAGRFVAWSLSSKTSYLCPGAIFVSEEYREATGIPSVVATEETEAPARTRITVTGGRTIWLLSRIAMLVAFGRRPCSGPGKRPGAPRRYETSWRPRIPARPSRAPPSVFVLRRSEAVRDTRLRGCQPIKRKSDAAGCGHARRDDDQGAGARGRETERGRCERGAEETRTVGQSVRAVAALFKTERGSGPTASPGLCRGLTKKTSPFSRLWRRTVGQGRR